MLIGTNFDSQCYEATNIPLGLAWIGAVLKENDFSVIGHDLQLEGRDLSRLKNKIASINPAIIGIQFHSLVTYDFTLKAVAFIKKEFPEIVVIGGGLQATVNPNPIFFDGNIDYVVLGEGEFVMLELAKYILRRTPNISPHELKGVAFVENGEIVNNGKSERIKDLNKLPLPDREIFQWDKYPQWVIMTARGCPYKCSFCSSKTYWGKSTRFRSYRNIIDEIDLLVNRYNVNSFLFNDDTFTLKRQRVVDLCNEIIKRDYDLSWACGTRADHLDKELLELMKEAGCVEVSFGLESANQKTLDLIKKDISSEELFQAVKICSETGIQSRVSVMLGLPGETLDDNRNTLKFLLEAQPNEVQIYPLMPYLGTEFRDDMESYEISILNDKNGDWTKDSLNPIAQTSLISQEEIVGMAREMVRTLVSHGYTHMTPFEKNTKQKLSRVVSTGLTAFQLVESYTTENSTNQLAG